MTKSIARKPYAKPVLTKKQPLAAVTAVITSSEPLPP